MPNVGLHQIFLPEDTSHNSSLPYIFVDSPCSSVNSGWTKTSAPHMFLSYANTSINDRTEECVPSKPVRNRSIQKKKMCKQEPMPRNRSSAHPFLQYASDTSDTDQSPDSSTEEPPSASRRYLDWGKSEQQFEDRCKEHLEKAYKVPRLHASSVARTVRKGAEMTARAHGREVSDSYGLYAAMLDRSISQKMNSPEVTSGKVTTTDVPSVHSQHLQEELEFLRCTLRMLVLPSASEECQENVQELPNPIFTEEIDPTELDRDYGIPKEITIRIGEDDGVSEQDIGFYQLGRPCPEEECPEEERPEIEGQSQLSTLRKEISEAAQLAKACRARTSKRFGLGRSPEYMDSTMELVYSTRAKGHVATPYSNMVKGELQKDRARGINFELCFKNWDVNLRGTYNGQVKKGLPHGRGVLRFDNRDLYIGEFAEGEMHGEGTLFCRSSAKVITLRGNFNRNEYLGSEQILSPRQETPSSAAA